VKDPTLIEELAGQFGNQCIVLAIDTKPVDGEWMVYMNGGRTLTSLKTKDWVLQATSCGAGEILLTSIDHDGTRSGFAVDFTASISELVNVPVIASGGGGHVEHFSTILKAGKADGALAAGVFHDRSLTIPALKKYLQTQQINIRL